MSDLPPLPSPPDLAAELQPMLAEHAKQVIAVLLPHLEGDPASALRIMESYARNTRQILATVGLPLSDQDFDPELDDFGVAGPRRRGRRMPAALGELEQIAAPMQLPALLASLESAQRLKDPDLEARIRAQIDLLVAPAPTPPPAAPAADVEG